MPALVPCHLGEVCSRSQPQCRCGASLAQLDYCKSALLQIGDKIRNLKQVRWMFPAGVSAKAEQAALQQAPALSLAQQQSKTTQHLWRYIKTKTHLSC
jgi:hypothetical protein